MMKVFIFLWLCTSWMWVSAQPTLKLVTSVRQKGPVAYRDPLRSISPDGKLFAYSDLRKLFLQPINGGGLRELEKNGSFIRYLTWTPDSKYIITYELGGKGDTWYRYDIGDLSSTPLWPESRSFTVHQTDDEILEFVRSQLRGLVWSENGQDVAGTVTEQGLTHVVTFDADGSDPQLLTSGEKIESLQWNPARTGWAGIISVDDKRYIDLNLGFEPNQLIEANSYGRMVFAKEGRLMYYAIGNEGGTLDLWGHNLVNNSREKLTNFTRDSYEPSISGDGKLVFKLQDYRIFIATVSGEGGETTTITDFQSEIPYWHPSGDKISFTYGTWRRVMNDAKYPDIAQNLGVVAVDRESPATKPEEVVRASYSEDQGMSWSPNLKWVTFHTHADGTDDIWIQPNGDPAKGKPLSKGGYETGWPRWSPDGNWIVCNTAYSEDRINKLFLIGVDQETGKITKKQQTLIPAGLEAGSFTDSQWTSDSRSLVVEYVVDENHKEIYKIAVNGGGKGELIHRFESDQLYSGIGLSNDNNWVAFIAPDLQGNFQVFKVSMDGSTVKQLTYDPTDKAHPVYSPTENVVAFSVFNYQSIFWMAGVE